MGREQWQSEQNNDSRAEQEGHAAMIEQEITEGTGYGSAADLIKDNATQKAIHDYFRQLLKKHGLTQAEAVNGADLDKDYGTWYKFFVTAVTKRMRLDNGNMRLL